MSTSPNNNNNKNVAKQSSSSSSPPPLTSMVKFNPGSPQLMKKEYSPDSSAAATFFKSQQHQSFHNPSPPFNNDVTTTSVGEEHTNNNNNVPTVVDFTDAANKNHQNKIEEMKITKMLEKRTKSFSDSDLEPADQDVLQQVGGGGDSEMESASADSDELHSRSSGSSGGTMSKLRKSTLPCGLNMPIMMSLLILIPIIFLAVYTGIPVSESVSAQSMLSDHRMILEDILSLCRYLQEERRQGSIFLFSTPNTTEETEAMNELTTLRDDSVACFERIMNNMESSDLEGKLAFLTVAREQMRNIAAGRVEVDRRAISGPEFRTRNLLTAEKMYNLMLYVAKDPRGEDLESRLLIFVALRKVQNSLASMRGAGSIALSGEHVTENIQEVYGMTLAMTRDMLYLREAGKPEVVADLDSWEHSYSYKQVMSMSEKIQSTNPAVLANISMDDWVYHTNNLLDMMNAADEKVFDVITNGKILKKIAIEEGMKMFGAILACLVATVLVIYYNNREQTRLEKALDSTAVLAAAVQRFVPKNQLRTMGVRSVTQVQAGMTTEVAQTIIFSDIMQFTNHAAQMSRLELFEWLQDYVARMTVVVSEEKSYISNFLGDGLMIIAAQPTNGLNACVKMHVAVDTLNLEMTAKGGTRPVQIGCGVHYGIVVAGVFGDNSRLTCTTIASEVNLASRLEHLTRAFGSKILASDAVIDQVSSEVFSFRCVGKVRVAGADKPLVAYDVYQSDPLATKTYKDETKPMFEEAVRLSETEPEVASAMFRELITICKQKGIHDKAVESRKLGTEMDKVVSTAMSIGSSQSFAENINSPLLNDVNNTHHIDSSDNNNNSSNSNLHNIAAIPASSSEIQTHIVQNNNTNNTPNVFSSFNFSSNHQSQHHNQQQQQQSRCFHYSASGATSADKLNDGQQIVSSSSHNHNTGVLEFEKDGEIRPSAEYTEIIEQLQQTKNKQQERANAMCLPVSAVPSDVKNEVNNNNKNGDDSEYPSFINAENVFRATAQHLESREKSETGNHNFVPSSSTPTRDQQEEHQNLQSKKKKEHATGAGNIEELRPRGLKRNNANRHHKQQQQHHLPHSTTTTEDQQLVKQVQELPSGLKIPAHLEETEDQ